MHTLDKFNRKRKVQIAKAEAAMKPHPNGIECPTCSKELWDSDPTMVLTSNPPQKNIHCPACGYRGYRLA